MEILNVSILTTSRSRTQDVKKIFQVVHAGRSNVCIHEYIREEGEARGIKVMGSALSPGRNRLDLGSNMQGFRDSGSGHSSRDSQYRVPGLGTP